MNNMLPTPYQNFIALSRYARWKGDARETWSETVSRYIDSVVKPKAGDDTYIKKHRTGYLKLRGNAFYASYDDCWQGFRA